MPKIVPNNRGKKYKIVRSPKPFEERMVLTYVYVKRKYHNEFQQKINEQAKPYR